MIPFPSNVRVWIATGRTDMRRGMPGLALLVQEGLKRDPHAGDVFVFRGRGGQQPTFYIQFTSRDDRIPLAPSVRAHIAGIAAPTRQGSEVHLYGRTARSESRVAELDVRRGLLCRHGAWAASDQHSRA